jgi:hypothetical protein
MEEPQIGTRDPFLQRATQNSRSFVRSIARRRYRTIIALVADAFLSVSM